VPEKITIDEGIRGRIIHPQWSDKRFNKFGINFEFDNKKRIETVTNIISGNISEAIKNAVREHGFGVMNAGVSKTYDLNTQWTRSHKQLRSTYWHTDWPKKHIVALYCPPQKLERKYQTALAGKTKVVEALAEQIEHIEKADEIDEFSDYRKAMAEAVKDYHTNGTEYESSQNSGDSIGFFSLLRNFHLGIYKNSTFMNDVTQNLLAEGNSHLHTWQHGQILLMDGDVVHTRHIPLGVKSDESILMRMIIEE